MPDANIKYMFTTTAGVLGAVAVSFAPNPEGPFGPFTRLFVPEERLPQLMLALAEIIEEVR